MTPNKVIEYVDRVKINMYTDEDKYTWMNTLEGLIVREVLGGEGSGLVFPDDADTELIVPAPYDDMYALYVMAMIDFHNREYDNYNNTVMVFKERLDQFKAWYVRNNRQATADNFRNVMG